MGIAATYVFWRYLDRPSGQAPAAAGLMLGVAQLSKFSMLVLYAVWPFLWAVRLMMLGPISASADRCSQSTLRYVGRGLVHGVAIVALSIVTIDAGYFFEGVGLPLGDFEFGCRTLTRPVPPGVSRPHSKNELLEATWQFRVNRFRGTWLGRMPMPLPEHYLLGFDEQKIETEGVPERYRRAIRNPNPAVINFERQTPQTERDDLSAYSVYLDGQMRTTGLEDVLLVGAALQGPRGYVAPRGSVPRRPARLPPLAGRLVRRAGALGRSHW